jgi:hypothetical protein
MSYNSRRPRQSKLATTADITRLANAAIANADVCPACGLAMPFVGGKHGQTCRKLRQMVKDADSATAHRLARAN